MNSNISTQMMQMTGLVIREKLQEEVGKLLRHKRFIDSTELDQLVKNNESIKRDRTVAFVQLVIQLDDNDDVEVLIGVGGNSLMTAEAISALELTNKVSTELAAMDKTLEQREPRARRAPNQTLEEFLKTFGLRI